MSTFVFRFLAVFAILAAASLSLPTLPSDSAYCMIGGEKYLDGELAHDDAYQCVVVAPSENSQIASPVAGPLDSEYLRYVDRYCVINGKVYTTGVNFTDLTCDIRRLENDPVASGTFCHDPAWDCIFADLVYSAGGHRNNQCCSHHCHHDDCDVYWTSGTCYTQC